MKHLKIYKKKKKMIFSRKNYQKKALNTPKDSKQSWKLIKAQNSLSNTIGNLAAKYFFFLFAFSFSTRLQPTHVGMPFPLYFPLKNHFILLFSHCCLTTLTCIIALYTFPLKPISFSRSPTVAQPP